MSQVGQTGRTYEFGLHDRLRVAREMAGFTTREFEKATGISRTSIYYYESRQHAQRPKERDIREWSRVTGFDVDWLLTGGEHGTEKISGKTLPQGESPDTNGLDSEAAAAWGPLQ